MMNVFLRENTGWRGWIRCQVKKKPISNIERRSIKTTKSTLKLGIIYNDKNIPL